MRRPLTAATIALLVLFAALATAGCGEEDAGGESGNSSDGIALLRAAAKKPIDSADVRMEAVADIPGFPILGDRLSVTAEGPVAMADAGHLPTLDLKLMMRAGGQSFPSRVTVVDDRAYVEFMGTPYEVDPKLIDRLPLDHMRKDDRLVVDPSRWLSEVAVEDGKTIGGDPTRLVTGKVDVGAVVKDVAGAIDSPEVRKQVERSGGQRALSQLSEENLDRIEQSIEDVEVEVNVDDEGYARRVFARVAFKVPESVENAAFDRGTLTFELVVNEIGVKVDPQPPVDPEPLSELLDFAGTIFGVEKPSDLWTVTR